MTECICYPERLLHPIPADMTWDQAAVVEPTANVVTDLLERTGVVAGDFVVVQGPGPVGLTAAMVARAAGAREVVVVGAPGDAPLRLPKARELGFDKTINIAEADPAEAVMDMTGGRGADIVVECSGAPAAIAATVDLVGIARAYTPFGGSEFSFTFFNLTQLVKHPVIREYEMNIVAYEKSLIYRNASFFKVFYFYDKRFGIHHDTVAYDACFSPVEYS